jgi:hypothetical protein
MKHRWTLKAPVRITLLGGTVRRNTAPPWLESYQIVLAQYMGIQVRLGTASGYAGMMGSKCGGETGGGSVSRGEGWSSRAYRAMGVGDGWCGGVELDVGGSCSQKDSATMA